MKHTKDTNKSSGAAKLAPPAIVGPEDLDRFKRRAEKLGLIIHKRIQPQKRVKKGKM